MIPRSVAYIGVLLAIVATAGGCAFVESAAEVTLGDPDLPRLTTEAGLTVASFNDALASLVPVPAARVAIEDYELPELPGLVLPDDATWAHVRSTLCDAARVGALKTPRSSISTAFPRTFSRIWR